MSSKQGAEPRKHRVPTEATLKELYANAYCCAFPDCNKPLYKVDAETGVRTLNSTAAHICARSEGGPRWNDKQSEAENRSAENLIALCREHSAEIDNLKLVEKYPVELLKKWKAEHLKRFDQQAWVLTDEDAEKILENYNVTNTVMNSVIDLGGKGGSAPGAGGGGGGVFGSSASLGGNGGKGGDTIIYQGTDATAPGAGGGGNGVFGDGAIASEGGEGGEILQGSFAVREGQTFQIEIGEGGKNGQNGGDTVFRILDENGNVEKTLRAKGGKAGAAGIHGNVSSFARPISEDELDNGANLSAFLMADYWRTNATGLQDFLGAGWFNVNTDSFPFVFSQSPYLVMTMHNMSVPTVIQCDVEVVSPSGSSVFKTQCQFEKLENGVLSYCVAVKLEFQVDAPGLYEIYVDSGDYRLVTHPVMFNKISD